MYIYNKEKEQVLLDPKLLIFFQWRPRIMHGIMILRFQAKDKNSNSIEINGRE